MLASDRIEGTYSTFQINSIQITSKNNWQKPIAKSIIGVKITSNVWRGAATIASYANTTTKPVFF